MNSIPRFENFHLDQNEHPTARNIKWPMYSMIHGLYDHLILSFTTVVIELLTMKLYITIQEWY